MVKKTRTWDCSHSLFSPNKEFDWWICCYIKHIFHLTEASSIKHIVPLCRQLRIKSPFLSCCETKGLFSQIKTDIIGSSCGRHELRLYSCVCALTSVCECVCVCQDEVTWLLSWAVREDPASRCQNSTNNNPQETDNNAPRLACFTRVPCVPPF